MSRSVEQPRSLERFLESLRQRFTAEPLAATGEFRMTAYGGEHIDPPPLLNMDRALFDDYLDAALAEWDLPPDVTDRTAEVLSLMAVHVEAALSSVDANGLNYVRELGLERDATGAGPLVPGRGRTEDAPTTSAPRWSFAVGGGSALTFRTSAAGYLSFS